MLNKRILKKSMALLLLVIFSALAWGDQKKNNAPSKPAPQVKSAPAPKQAQAPSRPAPQVKSAPAPRQTSTPSRPAPAISRTNTGASNKPTTTMGNKPTTTMGNKPTTTMGNRPTTTMGNKPTTTMGNKPTTTMGNRPTTTMGNRPTTGMGPRRTVQNVQLRGGGTAQISRRPNGRIADIHANGMSIHQGVRGGRTIMSVRNGRTIVNTGRRGGYVQSPYMSRGGRTYYQRTYVMGGRSYTRVYRGFDYRGARYYGYAPAFYYHSGFYGWAYHPWGRIFFGPAAWGWVGTPWFGLYGGWFTPYPVYPTAALWLTDYLIAANLQAAYQAQADANAAAQANAGGGGGQAPPDNSQAPPYGGAGASNQTPLSPEVKQAIADEVQRQLAAEQGAAANPQAAPTNGEVPDALNPAERVFVVSSNLDVTATPSGQECSLTAGDVVMRLSDTPDANQNVTASVQSSKGADCAAGQTVAIGVQDLQEMHNQFQAQLDSGMQTLASKGGTGGLPKPPDTGTTAGEVPAPTPDASAAAQLQQQQQQADQTAAQVAQPQQ